jgi:hypothetical protein
VHARRRQSPAGTALDLPCARARQTIVLQIGARVLTQVVRTSTPSVSGCSIVCASFEGTFLSTELMHEARQRCDTASTLVKPFMLSCALYAGSAGVPTTACTLPALARIAQSLHEHHVPHDPQRCGIVAHLASRIVSRRRTNHTTQHVQTYAACSTSCLTHVSIATTTAVIRLETSHTHTHARCLLICSLGCWHERHSQRLRAPRLLSALADMPTRCPL